MLTPELVCTVLTAALLAYRKSEFLTYIGFGFGFGTMYGLPHGIILMGTGLLATTFIYQEK